MPTFDMKLMTQLNQLFEPPTSSFRGETRPTCPRADTPDRRLNDSPCSSSSSSGTLFSEEEDLQPHAQAHKVMDDHLSLASESGKAEKSVFAAHIFSPHPRKSKFNPNAAPFVPSSHLELFSSPAPTLVDSDASPTQTWWELLLAGISTVEPNHRHHLARALVVSNRWTFDALCSLARHFCWTSVDEEHAALSPGPAALFARDVCNAMASAATEWESTCFAFQLKTRAQEHFASHWSSIDNPNAISVCRIPNDEQCRSAFDMSCFIADMFTLHLVDAPTMHWCLDILLREMAAVEHVFTIQAMIIRAGARLWQGSDSHRLLQKFTTSFVERSRLLRDDASLSGLETSIQEVLKASNIVSTINEWHARRSEDSLPTVTSIWA